MSTGFLHPKGFTGDQFVVTLTENASSERPALALASTLCSKRLAIDRNPKILLLINLSPRFVALLVYHSSMEQRHEEV
jgi:hypothetical protein